MTEKNVSSLFVMTGLNGFTESEHKYFTRILLSEP